MSEIIVPQEAIAFVAGGRDSREVKGGGIREVRGSVNFNPRDIHHTGREGVGNHYTTTTGGSPVRSASSPREWPVYRPK